nr:MAG TPA: hypothetical protein [Caudoviricetes sp.]
MNVYEIVNQQEFLDLLNNLGVTFKNDSVVLIKPSLGFKGMVTYDNGYTIATECFPIMKVRNEPYFYPLYSTPYVPRGQQATTSVVFNTEEVLYFNLGKYDMLLLVPNKRIIIMILGGNKQFSKWLVKQNLYVMNPRVDNTRVRGIEYPPVETYVPQRESSPLAKLINKIFGTDIKDLDPAVDLGGRISSDNDEYVAF